MSAFNFSGPAETLRAEQKDEELCERINGQLSEFILKFKGNKTVFFCSSQPTTLTMRLCFRSYIFKQKQTEHFLHVTDFILYSHNIV